MSHRRLGTILGLTMLLAGLMWHGEHGQRAVPIRSGKPSPSTARNASVATGAVADVRPAPPRPDPQQMLREGSLRGTTPDGGVSTGFGGRLTPDVALRRLFDYYLAMLGETDLDSIRQLLHDDLQQRHLDQPVMAEVMQVFDRYVRYQQAAVALARQPGFTLAARIGQVDTLRRQMLGDALTDALYADEEIEQRQLLQRVAIQSDRRLSDTEKSRRLLTLDASLPVAEQNLRAQAVAGDTVQQQTDQLDSEQADPATRHAERASLWGDQAADRLAQLDLQRARWQTRLDAYAQQAQAIRADPTLGITQRNAQLQVLLQRDFHGPEQTHVRAMEQAGLIAASTH